MMEVVATVGAIRHVIILTDYRSIILANVPKFVTDKLQRVLNASSHVVSGTKKSACHSCCMMNSTGLLCLNEFFSDWL